MMHGTFDAPVSEQSRFAVVSNLIWSKRRWLLIVGLPTLLVSLYYGLIASNQYESEAHFTVRNADGAATAMSGLSQALSMVGGGGESSSSSDVASVSDYLSSHDAVEALRERVGLVQIFQRPGVDLLSRLRPSNPTPEYLGRYYRGQVDVKMDTDTGLTTIRVRTFRPEDSYRVVNELLRLGEARVNVLNKRAYESTVRQARIEVANAEHAMQESQAAVTAFRQGRRSLDPMAAGQAQLTVETGLRAALAQATTQRAAMVGSVSPGSPVVKALDARIAALQAQVATQSARLAGGGGAIATNVGDYQQLQLKQQFASRRYEDASAALQRARAQAQRQQLFIVRVVEPNVPVKALYPKGAKVIALTFIALFLAYSIGWLIVAGVREHAA